ncbi:kanadaptin [Pogona vitticeps]
MAEPREGEEMEEDFKKPILPPPPPPPPPAPPTREKAAEGAPSAPALKLPRGCALPDPTAPKPPRGPAPGPCASALPEYQEPSWGGCVAADGSAGYSLEVLKSGAVLENISLGGRSWVMVGRAPGCHLSLAHPCVSRHHAVLQHRPPPAGDEENPGDPARREEKGPEAGLYVYDLDSAHGTFLNKVRVPPRTYCRVRVGHVLRFGGSSRLFVLQGPEEDQEPESELTVTQLKELHKKQQAKLEKTMLGDDSDEDQIEKEEPRNENNRNNDLSCSWGIGEDAEEEEGEENPIAIEFQEDQEAFYLKDPKKALQGFFDREGEELEYEFDAQGTGTWLCRVKLPVDDASGKQLVAEAVHSGKKKEAMIQCALEACRILDARGVLRQEAVSRKRKAKNWEEEDFYDSDDDTFLDRTGVIEQKRRNRMKKAGKLEEKPETYDSLVAKLNATEKELSQIAEKLKSSKTAQSQSAAQDSLDEFMTEIKSGYALDSVTRRKLHLRTFELKKEQQRLKGLIKIVTPASMPELKSQLGSQDPEAQNKPKKLTLPMFGAMKGGSKFKLKTGTVGKLPVKHPDIPVNLLKMKDEGPEEEEEEEEEDEDQEAKTTDIYQRMENSKANTVAQEKVEQDHLPASSSSHSSQDVDVDSVNDRTRLQSEPFSGGAATPVNMLQKKPQALQKPGEKPKSMKANSASRVQHTMPSKYPEDDPDYCVWMPPEGQSGDGRTHLNEKYGY